MNQFFLAGLISLLSFFTAGCDAQSPEVQTAQEPVVTSQDPTRPQEQQGSSPSVDDGAPAENIDAPQDLASTHPEQPNTDSTDTSEHDTATSKDDALVQLKQVYEAEIRTILDSRCQICHGSMSELNFSSFESVQIDALQMADAVASGRMPYDPALLPKVEKEKLIHFLEKLGESSR